MAKRRLSIRISTLLNVGIALVFVAVAAITIALVNNNMRQQALVEAESKVRILLDRNLATHTYFSQIMKPRLFEWTDSFRSADYFEPSWMSSTYAIRQIDKYFKSLSPSDYYFKDAAINARSPDNEADEYERAFLEELNADPQLEARSAVQTIGSQPYFVVLRRGEMMEESCLRCHGDPADAPGDLVRHYGAERSFHRQVGETVSAVSIHVPLSAAYAEADRVSTQLSALLLLLLGVLFAAQFWFYRRLLLKPVAVLRDKARQIASEEKHLGEEIPLPFGEELSELTAAFNTMSTGLRQSRDHLEARVQERTTGLQTANEQLQREITERERAEEALQEYSERLEEMVEERTKELRDAQEQLVRREKLAVIGQMAASVSHELRNPLGAISNAAYYLQLTHRDASEVTKEYLGMIIAEVRRSDRIISDLLDFSRTRVPDRQKVTVSELVAEVLEKRPPPENVQVTTEIPSERLRVYVDPHQMEQVLSNLVINAYQAMPEGGDLTISAQVEEGQVAISVADTGMGIRQENRSKLFQPLFTTKTRGLGLGLAVVKTLLEANGGSVDVESEEGKGSIFTIRLPLE